MAKKTYYESALSKEWLNSRHEALTRSKAKNNSKGSYDNIKRNSVYLANEFQLIGVNSPDGITKEKFSDWVDGLREGTFPCKELGAGTIKKRVETLRAILQANKLVDQLDFVQLWKPDKQAKNIKYWSVEEIEAMNDIAIKTFQNGKYMGRAVVHILHNMIAPRIDDSTSFKWEFIDFNERLIRFPATKNKKICSQYIHEPFVPLLMRYKEWVSQFDGGDVYLFPSSMMQKSGTTKKAIPHASAKTLAIWLKYIRDLTVVDGKPVQQLSSHSYRHTLAMRYLNSGNKYENVSMILGDDIATIEKYYSELMPNKEQRLAFEKAFAQSTQITSEGTAQPEWLKRRRGSNSSMTMLRSNAFRGTELRGGMDVRGFEPLASSLQTKHSSN